jgi:hypothetical protein
MPIFKAFDLNTQSAEVPGTRSPGATGTVHVALCLPGFVNYNRDTYRNRFFYSWS